MKFIMKFHRLMLCWLAAWPLAACGLSSGPINGVVLEEGTKKPIVGAIVAARWKGIVPVIGHSRRLCVHTESGVTNERGEFRLKSWAKSSSAGLVTDLELDLTPYKEGYRWSDFPSQNKGISLLAPFDGKKEERKEFLLRMAQATRCPGSGSSYKNIFPIYKAMYEELKRIAVTREDWIAVDILRNEAADVGIAAEVNVTSGEYDRLKAEFLKNNLK